MNTLWIGYNTGWKSTSWHIVMLELEMVSVTTLLPTLLPILTINVYLFHYDDIVIYLFFCVFTASAMLLVSLVPSNSFKQTFRMSRSMLSPHKDIGVCIHYSLL